MWNNQFLRSEKFLFIYRMHCILKSPVQPCLDRHATFFHDRECTVLHFKIFCEKIERTGDRSRNTDLKS